MKKRTFILAVTTALLAVCCCQKASAQTGMEVLNKAIAFHDSLNTWSNFSAKVHLVTAFPGNGNSGGEIIEVNTRDNYYKNTKLPSNIVRGIKDGKCFLVTDGKEMTPNKNQVASIMQYQGWHYFHFGILMELKASGLILVDKVEKVSFQGHDCLALTFNYDAGKLKNDFYNNSNWTIYLDPLNYSMKGFKETGVMNRYAVFSGILNVNGIKIPLCRTYFNNNDDSFSMVDLFTIEPGN